VTDTNVFELLHAPDCRDDRFRLTATTHCGRSRPPVDRSDERRWVIREPAWLRSFPQERGMLGPRLPMRTIRDVLSSRLPACPNARPPPVFWWSATAAGDFIWRAWRRQPKLTAAGSLDERGAGASVLRIAQGDAQGSPAATGLGSGAPGAAPARGDAAAVVGGASHGSPRRVWLRPFLRALSPLGACGPIGRRDLDHVRRGGGLARGSKRLWPWPVAPTVRLWMKARGNVTSQPDG
jgi:hypothetical protein